MTEEKKVWVVKCDDEDCETHFVNLFESEFDALKFAATECISAIEHANKNSSKYSILIDEMNLKLDLNTQKAFEDIINMYDEWQDLIDDNYRYSNNNYYIVIFQKTIVPASATQESAIEPPKDQTAGKKND